jgi:transposase-like protein
MTRAEQKERADKVAAEYERGDAVKAIAERHGIAMSTVGLIVTQRGIQKRREAPKHSVKSVVFTYCRKDHPMTPATPGAQERLEFYRSLPEKDKEKWLASERPVHTGTEHETARSAKK